MNKGARVPFKMKESVGAVILVELRAFALNDFPYRSSPFIPLLFLLHRIERIPAWVPLSDIEISP